MTVPEAKAELESAINAEKIESERSAVAGEEARRLAIALEAADPDLADAYSEALAAHGAASARAAAFAVRAERATARVHAAKEAIRAAERAALDAQIADLQAEADRLETALSTTRDRFREQLELAIPALHAIASQLEALGAPPSYSEWALFTPGDVVEVKPRLRKHSPAPQSEDLTASQLYGRTMAAVAAAAGDATVSEGGVDPEPQGAQYLRTVTAVQAFSARQP